MKTRTHRKTILSVFLATVVLCYSACAPASTPNNTEEAQLIEKGRYLSTAADCMACHTTPGGSPFAGGLAIDTPVGPVVSTNITPSRTAGIGNYTLEQFTQVLRRGVRADGQNLYPAMPYTSYAKISDDDIRAMYAYFMHGVKAVDTPAPRTSLPFPFNIRLAMAAWNLIFLDATPYHTAADKSPQWNRGAYLVNGLAHCSTCHTPRNLMMAEDSTRFLGGAYIGPWYAPNITSDVDSGIGSWSVAEIVQYLSSGHNRKAQAAGPMMEAIDISLRHLNHDDLQAIATYLKTIPAVHDPADSRPAHEWGKAPDAQDQVRGTPWPANTDQLTGPQLYDAHCATCHQARGQGSFEGGLPALFGNAATGRLQTNNLVLTILTGIHLRSQNSGTIMPGFANIMSDQQITTLSNYLLTTFGNPQARVTLEQVSKLRNGQPTHAHPINLLLAARIGMGVAVIFALWLISLILRRYRQHHTN